MRRWLVVCFGVLGACGAQESSDEGPPYSLGNCPQLVEGTQSFASGDLTYEVTVRLPAQTNGAPVLFLFHPLGIGVPDTLDGFGASMLVDELGAVVIAPASASGADFEWEVGIPSEDNRDMLMFHDLLGCARRGLGIDLDRVWASGMSAGGLWVSWLIFYASDWLTAAAPFSGGFTTYPPVPDRSIPVMVTWGGENDIYSEFNFDLATADLLFYLNDFGHQVIECEHDLGHDLPPEAPSMLVGFFEDLRYDEPGTGDPLARLPGWCRTSQ